MFIVYSDDMYAYTPCRYEELLTMGRYYDEVVRVLVIVLVDVYMVYV